jgi:hypothetical protein
MRCYFSGPSVPLAPSHPNASNPPRSGTQNQKIDSADPNNRLSSQRQRAIFSRNRWWAFFDGP